MGNNKSVDSWDVYENFQLINYHDLDIGEPNKIFTLINNNLVIGKIITNYHGNITVKVKDMNFKFCEYTQYAKCIYFKLRSTDYYGTLTIKQFNEKFVVRITYSNYKKFPFYISNNDNGTINCVLKKN